MDESFGTHSRNNSISLESGPWLCGHREDISENDANSGNFLQLIQLIATYAPIMGEHLMKIRLAHRPKISYLSPEIQIEFISALGSHVKKTNIHNIKKVLCIVTW